MSVAAKATDNLALGVPGACDKVVTLGDARYGERFSVVQADSNGVPRMVGFFSVSREFAAFHAFVTAESN